MKPKRVKVRLIDDYQAQKDVKGPAASLDFLPQLFRDVKSANKELNLIKGELDELSRMQYIAGEVYSSSPSTPASTRGTKLPKCSHNSKKSKKHNYQELNFAAYSDHPFERELTRNMVKKLKRKSSRDRQSQELYFQERALFGEGKHHSQWGYFSPTISTNKFKDCVINNFKSLDECEPYVAGLNDFTQLPSGHNILKDLHKKTSSNHLPSDFYEKLVQCALSLTTMIRYVPISNKYYVDRVVRHIDKHLRILRGIEENIMRKYHGKPPKKDCLQPIRKILSSIDDVAQLLVQARKDILVSEELWSKYCRLSADLDDMKRPRDSEALLSKMSKLEKHKKLALKLSKYTSEDSTRHVFKIHNKLCDKISFYYNYH